MSRPLIPLVRRRWQPAEPGGPRTAAVILAGGSGSRMGSGMNKVYLELAGRRVISWSLTWAREVAGICRFVLVVRPEDAELAEAVMHREAAGLPVTLVIGGSTRHESEAAALYHLADEILNGTVDVVAVHDGARPLAGPALWRAVIASAHTVGGGVPALPAGGVMGVGSDGHPLHTGDALFGLTRVQTPQAFRAADLLSAYELAGEAQFQGTDTASTAETHSKLTIRVVAGTRTNVKITYPHDIFLAERLLASNRYHLP